MQIVKLTILIIAFPFIVAVSVIDATKYGSSILICKTDNSTAEKVVRYWSLGESNGTKKIIDKMNFRSYSLDSCHIFYCSPNPARMLNCVLPADNPRYLRETPNYTPPKYPN